MINPTNYSLNDIRTLQRYKVYFAKADYENIGTFNEEGNVEINQEFFDAVDSLFAAHVAHLNEITTSPLLKANVPNYETKLREFLSFFQGNQEAASVYVAENRDHKLHERLLEDVMSTDRWRCGIVPESNVKHFHTEARYNSRSEQDLVALESFYFGSEVDSSVNYIVKRINALKLLGDYRVIDTNYAKYMNNIQKYKNYLNGMVDFYNWQNVQSFVTGDDVSKTCIKVQDAMSDHRVKLFSTRKDMMNLIENTNIKLQHSELLFNGRRTLIQAVEEVPKDEIEKAAKKMKFNGDLSSVRCYKITAGVKVKSVRMFNDYWMMRRCDNERIEDNLVDLTDHYIVVSENETSAFQAVTTTIGRSLSSVNRKVTSGVMDALELSF